VGATLLLVLGFVTAALLAAGDGSRDTTRTPQSRGTTSSQTSSTGITTTETATTETATTETTTEPAVDGFALNDEGYRLMQAGEYEAALPLLRSAVIALNGSGVLAEAYASYNLAFTRFSTGHCDGVLGLLERSERIQGQRDEIDDLRRDWERECAADGGGDGESGPGKGKGKGNGKGNGNDDD
jgi:hypothetical protein